MKISKRIKNFLKWIVAIVVIVFFIFFPKIENNFSKNLEVNNIQFVKISGQLLKVDLALTFETQAKGLSGRDVIKENEGMLFVFQKPKQNYFWMKEMNFPIDIIWIDENLKIIFIEKNIQPETFPEVFGPDKKSLYVLEVKAGFSEKNNLKERDEVEFLP